MMNVWWMCPLCSCSFFCTYILLLFFALSVLFAVVSVCVLFFSFNSIITFFPLGIFPKFTIWFLCYLVEVACRNEKVLSLAKLYTRSWINKVKNNWNYRYLAFASCNFCCCCLNETNLLSFSRRTLRIFVSSWIYFYFDFSNCCVPHNDANEHTQWAYEEKNDSCRGLLCQVWDRLYSVVCIIIFTVYSVVSHSAELGLLLCAAVRAYVSVYIVAVHARILYTAPWLAHHYLHVLGWINQIISNLFLFFLRKRADIYLLYILAARNLLIIPRYINVFQ